MKIFISKVFKDKFLSEDILKKIELTSEEQADFCLKVSGWKSDTCNIKQEHNTIYWMRYLSASVRKNIRYGFCVDDRINLKPAKNFCFSRNDFCSDDRIIYLPVEFNTPHSISKNPYYWRDEPKIENIQYHNRLYWKGNIKNHETRKMIFDFYKNKDSRFIVDEFKQSIYTKPCYSNEHDNFTKELLSSDASFCLRGDRPSTHSFFDMLQYGCIPITINCMDIGWHNIMHNVEDYMLEFDLRKHTIDYIHSSIEDLLKDKERVLRMKRNCINLFEKVFKFQGPSAWGDFMVAKSIEIYKNNFDVTKIDNNLICEEYLNLKGFKKF